MRRTFAWFSTRTLLICVVLGAFTAAFVHLSRILGVLFWSVAPWLGAPAPVVPWFLMLIVAAILVPRFGSALIAGVIGAVVGVGTMALFAAIVIELVFLLGRWLVRRRHEGTLPAIGDRTWLWWGMLAGVAAGVMSYGFMFTVREFLVLPGELMLAALGVRIVTGAIFGWLAWLIVKGLLRAGFEPDAGRRRGRARTSTTDDEGPTVSPQESR